MSVGTPMSVGALEQLRYIFTRYDDPKDAFDEIRDIDVGGYICYKKDGMYGTSIHVCDNNGSHLIKLLLYAGLVTTFYNSMTGIGLFERIYSNRTEYYIDGVYHSCCIDEDIDEDVKKLILLHTKLVFGGIKYPKLSAFINSNENVDIIPIDEIDGAPKK